MLRISLIAPHTVGDIAALLFDELVILERIDGCINGYRPYRAQHYDDDPQAPDEFRSKPEENRGKSTIQIVRGIACI